MIDRRVISEAIFGGADGTMTALGVALSLGHAARHTIAVTAVCVALTGALSMAGGVLIEDDRNGLPEAAAMGAATAVGTFLPVLPLLLWRQPWAYLATAVLAVGVAAVIAAARGGRRRDFAVSFGVLAAVAVPTVLVAVAFGAAG